jgi:hypothetical protein
LDLSDLDTLRLLMAGLSQDEQVDLLERLVEQFRGAERLAGRNILDLEGRGAERNEPAEASPPKRMPWSA